MVKACELLGVACGVEHLAFTDERPAHTHRICIIRDPRNVLCSWLRFRKKPVTADWFLLHLQAFQDGQSLVEAMAPFEGWLTDAETLIVRYEALIARSAEMQRIARFVGVPYVKGAFIELPRHTRTWNAVHSDYRQLWTPEVEEGWQEAGGPNLLSRWGYA